MWKTVCKRPTPRTASGNRALRKSGLGVMAFCHQTSGDETSLATISTKPATDPPPLSFLLKHQTIMKVEKKKDDNPIQENEVLPGCVASFPTWTPVA